MVLTTHQKPGLGSSHCHVWNSGGLSSSASVVGAHLFFTMHDLCSGIYD